MSTDLDAASFTFNTVKLIYDVANSIAPITGYQYTKDGGEQLDQALAIINGPRGANLDDHLRQTYLQSSDELVAIRHDLVKDTKTCIGSITNIKVAQVFYKEAGEFHNDVRTSSHQADIKKNLRELKRRREMEGGEVWEREGDELQARMHRIVEETLPSTSIPENNPSAMSHPNLARPANQMPAYPPAAYHEANSSRC